MSDIKKKFLDILFETEGEEVDVDAPLTDIKNPVKENVQEVIKEQVKAPSAKDILYGKQDKPSSFIDYFEVPRSATKVEEEDVSETYEMRENVSPIFGLINQKERKKKTATEKEIQKAVTNTKGDSEYTGIVLSPIYGYDNSKANDARKKVFGFEEEKQVMSDEEIEQMFADEEMTFEMPDEETSEAVMESLMESVPELKPSENYTFVKKIYEVPEVEEEEFVEEKVETPLQEEEHEEQPSYNENYEQQVSFEEEKIEEPQTFETYEEKPQEETIISEPVEREEEKVEFEPYTQEITKEDIEEAFNRIDAKPVNKSIYDTTPIKLFDMDELTQEDDSEKDLFDELIGDDR